MQPILRLGVICWRGYGRIRQHIQLVCHGQPRLAVGVGEYQNREPDVNYLHTLSAYMTERCSSRSVATSLLLSTTRCEPIISRCKMSVSVTRPGKHPQYMDTSLEVLITHRDPLPSLQAPPRCDPSVNQTRSLQAGIPSVREGKAVASRPIAFVIQRKRSQSRPQPKLNQRTSPTSTWWVVPSRGITSLPRQPQYTARIA